MSTIANVSAYTPVDCTGLAHVDFKPYASMTGNGSLTTILGTAYFVLFLVAASYILAFNPSKTPVDNSESPSSNGSWQPNTIDRQFLTWIRKTSRITPRARVRLQSAFDQSIITLCHYHTMFGFGGLCQAYEHLIYGLDACHWHMLVYLAWFSAASHLSVLTVLRTYHDTEPWARHARVFFMFAHVILLVVALRPTGFFASGKSVASQAICYFNSNYGYWRFEAERSELDSSRVEDTEQWQTMLLSMVLLTFGSIIGLVNLSQPLSTAFRRGVRQPLSGWCRRGLMRLGPLSSQSSRLETLRSNIITKPALAIFLTIRLSFDLFSSRLFEIILLVIILLWGTVRLFHARDALISQSQEISTAENQWGLDHPVSTFLLLSVTKFLSVCLIFISRVGIFEMRAIFSYSSRDQRRSVTTANPIPGQDHPSGDLTEMKGTPGSHQDNEERPNASTPTPASADSSISSPEKDGLQYLDDYSDALWLPICAAIPLLSILPATMILFVSISNIDKSLKSPLSFYEIWVSKSNLLYFLLISYPCACATTIRFGMGMDLSSRWKKFRFFWLCLLIYAVHCLSVVGPDLFPVDGFTV